MCTPPPPVLPAGSKFACQGLALSGPRSQSQPLASLSRSPAAAAAGAVGCVNPLRALPPPTYSCTADYEPSGVPLAMLPGSSESSCRDACSADLACQLYLLDSNGTCVLRTRYASGPASGNVRRVGVARVCAKLMRLFEEQDPRDMYQRNYMARMTLGEQQLPEQRPCFVLRGRGGTARGSIVTGTCVGRQHGSQATATLLPDEDLTLLPPAHADEHQSLHSPL